MSLFKNLFGKEDKQEPSNEPNPLNNNAPCKNEKELIERYGGIAFEKQIHLSEIIGNNSWNIDMKKAEISFGPQLVLPIQVLGTLSHSSNSWLWAWANTRSGLSAEIQQQALTLKKYGEDNQIDLLRNSEFNADKSDMHLIGLIASGMFNTTGYYIADYGQGAMLVTIKSNQTDLLRKEEHLKLLTTFPQFISQFEMNHKAALTNYLMTQGYKVNIEGNKLTGTKNANTITAEFDEQGRMKELNG